VNFWAADADGAGVGATPKLPISILLLPVVRFAPAKTPNAMLSPPVVLLKSASIPVARVVAAACVTVEAQ